MAVEDAKSCKESGNDCFRRGKLDELSNTVALVSWTEFRCTSGQQVISQRFGSTNY
jgi:hypothetical protein